MAEETTTANSSSILPLENDNDTTTITEIPPLASEETATGGELPRSKRNMLKNVFLLSGMWGCGLGAALVQVASAQNALIHTGHERISTIPFGLLMLLSAPCAVFIPKLIHRFGDKAVFCAASLIGIVGALVQMAGVFISKNSGSSLEITFLMVGALIQSFTFASTNNVRFAVAYFSTSEFLPKATALVVLGGAVGALIGPKLSNLTRNIFEEALYAGNFLQIALLYFVYGILAISADFAPPAKASRDIDMEVDKLRDSAEVVQANYNAIVSVEEGVVRTEDLSVTKERSLLDILKNTDLILLLVCQSLSYNIMVLYMTDLQLPMAELGYSNNQGTNAIFAHMLGMFLPSLFSGHLIGILGTWPSTLLGFSIFVLGGSLFYVSNSVAMFTIGITVIGIGWNLSFVGPSSEVSRLHQSEAEKSKIQGFNDGIMLFTIGVFSLSASSLYEVTGSNWHVFDGILLGVTGIAMGLVAFKIVYQKKVIK